MSKRWIATHLLPILLAIILVSGSVVYAVPSWRNKATQIASKTIGTLADIVSPEEEKQAEQPLFYFSDPNRPKDYKTIIDKTTGEELGSIDLSPNFVSYDQIENTEITLTVKDTSRFVKILRERGDTESCALQWEIIDPGGSYPLSYEGWAPYSGGALRGPECLGIAKFKFDKAGLIEKIKGSYFERRPSSVMRYARAEAEARDFGSALAYIGLYLGPIDLELNPEKRILILNSENQAQTNLNLKTKNIPTQDELPNLPVLIEWDKGDIVNAPKDSVVSLEPKSLRLSSGFSYQFQAEEPGYYNFKARVEDSSGWSKESSFHLSVYKLNILLDSPDETILEKETPRFTARLAGNDGEKDVEYLPNREVEISADKNTIILDEKIQGQAIRAITDADGQVTFFLDAQEGGLTEITIKDLETGIKERYQVTVSELPDLSICFCTDVSEQTIEYDPLVDKETTAYKQSQRQSALFNNLSPLKEIISQKLSRLFVNKNPESAKAQEASSNNKNLPTAKLCFPGEATLPSYQGKPITTSIQVNNSKGPDFEDLLLMVELTPKYSEVTITEPAGNQIYAISGITVDPGSSWDLITYKTTDKEGKEIVEKYELKTTIDIKAGENQTYNFVLYGLKGRTFEEVLGHKVIITPKKYEEASKKTGVHPNFFLNKARAETQRELPKKEIKGTLSLIKLLVPEIELVDIQRKNEKGEYISISQERFKDQKDRNELEIYPGDQLIFSETITNTNTVPIKGAKLGLTLPKIKGLVSKEGDQILQLSDNKESNKFQDIASDLPELGPKGSNSQTASKKFTITLPENIDLDIKSLKFTPTYITSDGRITKEGKDLNLELWDWLEGIVTGPYGHPVPNAYITLVDKDNNDIEHTYYEEELTSTAKEKLGKDEKTLDFTLTDYDENKTEKQGFYKIKLNRNEDLLIDDQVKIALYFRNHQDTTRAKLLFKSFSSLPQATGFVSLEQNKREIEDTQLRISPKDFASFKKNPNLYIAFESGSNNFWEYPKDSLFQSSLFGNYNYLDIAKVAAEVYYNIIQAWHIADKLWNLNLLKMEKPLEVSLTGDSGDAYFNETGPLNFFGDKERSSNPAIVLGADWLLGPNGAGCPDRKPGTELHEFGHFLTPIMVGKSYGDFYSWLENKYPLPPEVISERLASLKEKGLDHLPHLARKIEWKNHRGYSDDISADSLLEGWADFFATEVETILTGFSDRKIRFACGGSPFRNLRVILPIFITESTTYSFPYLRRPTEDEGAGALLVRLREGLTEINSQKLPWINTGLDKYSFEYPLSQTISFKQIGEIIKKGTFSFQEIYQLLKSDGVGQTGNLNDLNNLDQLFVALGIFYDWNGNWKFDYGYRGFEEIGRPANRAPFLASYCQSHLDCPRRIGHRPWRKFYKPLSGSYIKYNLRNTRFHKTIAKMYVKIEFDAPLEFNNFAADFYGYDDLLNYLELPSGWPTKAIITAEGDSNPLVIDSDDYWQMIDSGMFDYIAEHNFYVDGGRPAGISGEVQPPVGDPAGPPSNQQPSFNNLPENEKPLAVGETEELKNLRTEKLKYIETEEPQTTIDRIADQVISDPVFEAVSNVASTIIDDVNLVIETISGRKEAPKAEVNINELTPQLETCIRPYREIPRDVGMNEDKRIGGEEDKGFLDKAVDFAQEVIYSKVGLESPQQKEEHEKEQIIGCRTDLTNLYQGDKLKVEVSLENPSNQALSGFTLSTQLDYSKPLYNIDPKDGLKQENIETQEQKNIETIISWKTDNLGPGETLTKEFEIEIKENDFDNLTITSQIAKGDLEKLGQAKNIFIGKMIEPKIELLSIEREGEILNPSTTIHPGDNLNFKASLENFGEKSAEKARLIVLYPKGLVFKTNEIHKDLIEEYSPEDLFGYRFSEDLYAFALPIDSDQYENQILPPTIEKFFSLEVPQGFSRPIDLDLLSQFNGHFIEREKLSYSIEPIIESQEQVSAGAEEQRIEEQPLGLIESVVQEIKASLANLGDQVQVSWQAIEEWFSQNLPDLWQDFKSLFIRPEEDNRGTEEQKNIETEEEFHFLPEIQSFLVPKAYAQEVTAGPTISLSSQTPSPVKAPTTLIIDCQGFDKSQRVTVYLDNKEYKSSPIISKNFGIKVEIPKNIMLGTHTIKVVGENDQEAEVTFKVNENSWWNKKIVGIGVSSIIALIILISLIILIKRRKKLLAR